MILFRLLYLLLQRLVQSFSYLVAHGPVLVLVDFCFDDKDYFGDFFNWDEVAGDSFSCSQSSKEESCGILS